MQTASKSPAQVKKQAAKASPLKIKLNAISEKFQIAESFDDGWNSTEKDIHSILHAENLRFYKHTIYQPEIVAKIKVDSDTKEVRHLLSPASLAGYTALTLQPFNIKDVRDDQAVAALNPQLKFNKVYDNLCGVSTRSVISVPMLYENAVLGVFQAVNPVKGGEFTNQDMTVSRALAGMMARKIRSELNVTKGPFDYLVVQGRLTDEKLKELKQKAREEKTWVSQLMRTELGIDPEEIGHSLEKYYQVPFVKYNPSITPPEAFIKGVSKYYLKSRLWVPISGDPDKVVVLMSDPKDKNKIMEIQKLLNAHSYEFNVGLPEDILAYLGTDTHGQDKTKEKRAREDSLAKTTTHVVEGAGTRATGDSITAIQYVNNIIIEAENIGASDIHIEPGQPNSPAVVRARIDGACRQILEIPESEIKAVVSRIKIMAGLDIAERRKPQDGKVKFELPDKELELRVATLPTVNGESVVLRLLAASGTLPFDKLNLSSHNEAEIDRLILFPHGIFLVVGPTGSGKTTTLHAVLGRINTPDRKIWTAEDPVEITQPGLQQVQVIHKIGLDFASVMRSFLRADPDVILIGEMRDFETANIGIESSLTGHLVFSTLHTNSAPETIIRLLDLGLDPFNFSDALLGILAQRLVRTLCSNCKEPYKPTEEEYERLVGIYNPEYFSELGVSQSNAVLPKPVGCPECGNTGYLGRTGIHELLVASKNIKRLVAKKAAVEEIRDKAIEEGMRTLIQDGAAKILKGDTDLKQLHRVAAE
jgi:type II secretory ATPase GspE/PulE/Tfp pilus assembly ATPase PilB-like protein